MGRHTVCSVFVRVVVLLRQEETAIFALSAVDDAKFLLERVSLDYSSFSLKYLVPEICPAPT